VAAASVYYGGGWGVTSFMSNVGTVDQLTSAGVTLLTDSSIFSSGESFGRFLGSVAVNVGVEGGLNMLLPGWSQTAMVGMDLALSTGAAINGAAGGPDALTRSLRLARVSTRGIDAVKSCAADATAGNRPPVSNDEFQRIAIDAGSTAKGIIDDYKDRKKHGKRTPTPLAVRWDAAAPGALSKLGAVPKAYVQSLRENPISNVTAFADALISFDNAKHDWTPGEFGACLMVQMTGGA
jgi:hypothetical protein